MATRPNVARKLRLTPDRVDEFVTTVTAIGTSLDGFAEPFTYERDQKDAHYVNLALAADARLIVSRDRDLLALMHGDGKEAADVLRQFPDFRVLTPVEFLNTVAASD